MNYRILAYSTLAAFVAVLCLATYMSFKLDDLEKKNKALIANNMAMTKQSQADVSDAFKMGIITCTNEDVDFLNEIADEYDNTVFGKIIREWAQTWAYEDDYIQKLVDEYMNGDSK